MRTPITLTLDVDLATRFNSFIYRHQLRKGRTIEGLITEYLDKYDRSDDSIKVKKF